MFIPLQGKNCSVLATENPAFFHDLAPLGSGTRSCFDFRWPFCLNSHLVTTYAAVILLVPTQVEAAPYWSSQTSDPKNLICGQHYARATHGRCNRHSAFEVSGCLGNDPLHWGTCVWWHLASYQAGRKDTFRERTCFAATAGLMLLDKAGIVHNDIKPDNLIWTKESLAVCLVGCTQTKRE